MDSYDQTIQEVLRFARTPQGQQLIKMLQTMDAAQLQQAAQQAKAGNTAEAMALLEKLRQNPQAEKLLQQFGR